MATLPFNCDDDLQLDRLPMESPFQSLLFTNASPSDADSQRIRDLLREPLAQLADLDVQIEQLVTRRNKLREYADAHLALLSPIRRLPQDVMRDIFVACMPSGRNAVMSPSDAPLLLCQICSAWRDLALSTPKLWASIHIVAPSRAEIIHLTEIVASWLGRSGNISLSISLTLSKNFGYPDFCDPVTYDISVLTNALVAVSRRWRHVTISPPQLIKFTGFSRVSVEDVPILETISLDTLSVPSYYGGRIKERDPEEPWKYLPFLEAPTIRRISITGTDSFPTLRISGARLTHLALRRHLGDSGERRQPVHSLTAAQALSILNLCPALEFCALCLTGDFPSNSQTTISVSLHSLRELFISNETWYPIDDTFFAHLLAPGLLDLSYEESGSTLLSPHMHTFFPALERLRLAIPKLIGKDLIETLSPPRFPHLAVLELDREPYHSQQAPSQGPDGDFLAGLASTGRQLSLRRLCLRNFKALSDDAVLAFASSSSIPSLEELHVKFWRPPQRDIKADLKRLVPQVTLEYAPLGGLASRHSPWEGVWNEKESFEM